MGEGADRAHRGGLRGRVLPHHRASPPGSSRPPGRRKNCSIPLPKPGRRVHNARPAKERSTQAGKTWRRRTKKRITRRTEEQTSELQSLIRISFAFFCLKNK